MAFGARLVFRPQGRRHSHHADDFRDLCPIGNFDRSAHRGRCGRGPRRTRPESRRRADGALACAHPAKFPDAVERAAGVRPRLPALSPICMHEPSGTRCCRTIWAPSGISSPIGRDAAGGRHDDANLDPGKRTADRHRPHRYGRHRLARHLGRCRHPARAGRDQRRGAFSRTHGVQGHRSGAARLPSPRRSRRSAATSTPTPRAKAPPITPRC